MHLKIKRLNTDTIVDCCEVKAYKGIYLGKIIITSYDRQLDIAISLETLEFNKIYSFTSKVNVQSENVMIQKDRSISN